LRGASSSRSDVHHYVINISYYIPVSTYNGDKFALREILLDPQMLPTHGTVYPRGCYTKNNAGFEVITRNRDSSVGIATGYGLDDRRVEVGVPVGSRIFSSPRRPHRFWGPASLLSNGYRGLFPRGMKLTTHLQLVPRARKPGSIHPLPHTPSWRSA
jgi:hypothetical protein